MLSIRSGSWRERVSKELITLREGSPLRPDGTSLLTMTSHTFLNGTALTLAALLVFSVTGAVARETTSLDGAWQIVFDQKNEGRNAGWYRQKTFEALAAKRTVQVPSCWETIE